MFLKLVQNIKWLIWSMYQTNCKVMKSKANTGNEMVHWLKCKQIIAEWWYVFEISSQFKITNIKQISNELLGGEFKQTQGMRLCNRP